jgi:hypothetical protein
MDYGLLEAFGDDSSRDVIGSPGETQKPPLSPTFDFANPSRKRSKTTPRKSSPLESKPFYWKTVHHVENHSRYVCHLCVCQRSPKASTDIFAPQPECVPTSNNFSNTLSRPRRETSSKPSNSKSASRTMIPNVTSVSPEPSVCPLFPARV